MRMKQSLALLCALLSVFTAPVVVAEEELIQPLIRWLIENEGVFNNKLEVRREFPDDPDSRFGMFAKEDIPEDQMLLTIPRKMLLTAGDDKGRYGGLWCPTVHNLIKEMKKGDESFYAPYTNYLASQSQGQLPSHWSEAGQSLLLELLGHDDDDSTNDLPPAEVTDWISHEWKKDCKGSDDRFEQHCALLLIQRGWDDIMIPVYDMMSHRNGEWLNTKSNSVHKKTTDVKVRAKRDIQAGEEIYTSYNFCTDCGNKLTGYGTAELLRDFGFVENYPQRWFFGRHGKSRISFKLDEGEDGELEVEWLEKKPTRKKAKVFMLKQLDRLKDFAGIELEFPDEDVPPGELWMIRHYHQSVTSAIEYALDDLGVEYNESTGCEDDDQSCALSIRYDDLSWRKDDINYAVYTCDTDKSMSYEGFDQIEEVQSFYQRIDYYKDPKNENVCFDIEHIIQMCGSYRPHYHEMVVHYTARFLPEIKRVLWVGGGDSMLLHEIIKYPNLEFVVGLELDQTITRLSYKHLGTQPHFDNPKVQWWFGDAAKSLLMLPEDYFGSFDMVLVDLSETVMSFSVTDGLDIMQALSLLLKPEGIFVKNELYLEKMADIFDYSIQIHFPGVPIMCSQCLIFGSNKVDFLYGELTDHTLNNPNLYIPAQDDIEDRYEYLHDYRRNSTSMNLCKEGDEPAKEPVEQTRSPGILMIVEAEEATANLKDPKKVLNTLKKALEKEGLKMVSSATSKTDQGAIVTIILHEGYVMVRTWPKHKYAAMDIHFWSSFEKHDAAKKALVAALGSKNPSSYRIVAGGMFGVKTWKDDDKLRGPRVTDTCKDEVTAVRESAMEKTVSDTMLEESLKLVEDKDITVAVLCGEEKEGCKSVEILKEQGFAKVVALYSCPGISNEFEEGVMERMIGCENQLYRTLMDSVTADKKFSSVIIDPSAPISLSRIAYKIFKAKKYKLLEKDIFAMAVMFQEGDSWRQHFLERFRKDIITYDPNFRAEILFNSTDASMEMGVTSSGDEAFVRKVKEVVSTIETKTGLVSDVRDIKGGLFAYDHDWEPSHFFLPQDYDQRSPFDQWKSQKPVGYQTIFQLEPKNDQIRLELSAEIVKSALKETLSKMESKDMQESKDIEKAELTEVTNLGDGAMVVAHWSGGHVVALWDGRTHIDLNLFTYNESLEFANKFAAAFKARFGKGFKTALRDVQPRGYGRVVSFLSDMKDIGVDPHWAKFKE